MTDKYRVSDRQRPEPTPADFFSFFDRPESEGAFRQLVGTTCDQWRESGAATFRLTITGPDIEGDESGYPDGLWLEGWNDPRAVMLPFGAAWPSANSAIWPPLTAQPPID